VAGVEAPERSAIELCWRPPRALAGAPFVAPAAPDAPGRYPWIAGNDTFASI
jgi:hypothetical protein